MQSDWRDRQPNPIQPSPRYAALLDWVRSTHPEWWPELERLTHALAAQGAQDGTPAAHDFDRRIFELRALWEAAGSPDLHGRLIGPTIH